MTTYDTSPVSITFLKVLTGEAMLRYCIDNHPLHGVKADDGTEFTFDNFMGHMSPLIDIEQFLSDYRECVLRHIELLPAANSKEVVEAAFTSILKSIHAQMPIKAEIDHLITSAVKQFVRDNNIDTTGDLDVRIIFVNPDEWQRKLKEYENC